MPPGVSDTANDEEVLAHCPSLQALKVISQDPSERHLVRKLRPSPELGEPPGARQLYSTGPASRIWGWQVTNSPTSTPEGEHPRLCIRGPAVRPATTVIVWLLLSHEPSRLHVSNSISFQPAELQDVENVLWLPDRETPPTAIHSYLEPSPPLTAGLQLTDSPTLTVIGLQPMSSIRGAGGWSCAAVIPSNRHSTESFRSAASVNFAVTL